MTSDWPFGHLRPGAYGVILADPPWRFRTWSEKNQKKTASRHYPVMRLDAIKALPVSRLAARDCLLMMWAIQPMVPQALAVMEAWGFRFKSAGAWAKRSSTGRHWAFGTGYLFRGSAEFWIAGTIGKPKSHSKRERNLIVAPVREHSRKPDEMHEMLERMFPAAARCELFARRQRPGWAAWGDEIPADAYDPVANARGGYALAVESMRAQIEAAR